jgi:flavodoxin
MKALVVYYSRTGTTQKVAEKITKQLHADIERIIDTKNRKGIIGYLLAGRDAMRRKLTAIDKIGKDPQKYDIIIIGTPLWGWQICPAVRTFIEEHKKKIKKVAFFCTKGGSPAQKLFVEMEKISGHKAVAVLELLERDVKAEKVEPQIKEFVKKIATKNK